MDDNRVDQEVATLGVLKSARQTSGKQAGAQVMAALL